MNRKTSSILFASVLACACTTAQPSQDAASDDGATGAAPTIVLASGGSLAAVAGDVLRLQVMLVSPSGARTPLPAGAVVTWSGAPLVTALPSGTDPTESNLPATGSAPTAFFLSNASHYTDDELAGALFVIDAGTASGGTLTITAHVIASGIDASPSATIPVAAVPTGTASRGATYYAANCGHCHGASGEGGIGPGLNTAAGNLASDPSWTSALFASVTRGDIDDNGVAESAAMPNWMVAPTLSGAPLTTQDLVDVYAWLLTQP